MFKKLKQVFDYKYYEIGLVIPPSKMANHSYQALQEKNKVYGRNYTVEKAKESYIKERRLLIEAIAKNNKLTVEEVKTYVQVITVDNIQINPYYKAKGWVEVWEDKRGRVKVNYHEEIVKRAKLLGLVYYDGSLINIEKDFII